MYKLALLAVAALLPCFGPCSAAPRLEAYGRLPGVELMRLSPSGERYATVAVTGESRKLYAVSFDGKALAESKVGEAKVRNLAWAGDDHILVTTSATFDEPQAFARTYELFNVVNIALDDNAAAGIFDRYRNIANFIFGDFGQAQSDGHLFGYFSAITYASKKPGDYVFDHYYPDLYRVDLKTGEAAVEVRGTPEHDRWVVSRDGSVVAHSEYREGTGEWWLYAGKDDDKLLFKKTAPIDDIRLLGQGRTPGTVLVADESGDEDLVQEVSVADGKSERLFGSDSIEDYLFDPDSGLLIGARVEDEPGAMFFDPHLQARYEGTRKAFPGLQMRLVSFSRDLDRLIVLTDGGDDSGTYWMVDIASGKAKEIAHPYPEIGPADVGPQRRVKYAAADGTPIEGILTLPQGRKPEKLPLVVMPHGGPIGFHDSIGFDWWAQAYASAGYAVLQPNYRGSSGYGRAFRQAGYGEWGGKMLTDISGGIAPLAAQGLIDPKRVCIVGASYGGYAALAGVTLQKGIYRCAVSVAGVSDMPGLLRWHTPGRSYYTSVERYFRAATGADKDGGRMRAISPVRFAEQADAPILLIHGRDDTRVPFEQSEAMASALKHAGKPCEFVAMKGEDHFLSREETRITMLKAAVEFVKRNNPPD